MDGKKGKQKDGVKEKRMKREDDQGRDGQMRGDDDTCQT